MGPYHSVAEKGTVICRLEGMERLVAEKGSFHLAEKGMVICHLVEMEDWELCHLEVMGRLVEGLGLKVMEKEICHRRMDHHRICLPTCLLKRAHLIYHPTCHLMAESEEFHSAWDGQP